MRGGAHADRADDRQRSGDAGDARRVRAARAEGHAGSEDEGRRESEREVAVERDRARVTSGFDEVPRRHEPRRDCDDRRERGEIRQFRCRAEPVARPREEAVDREKRGERRERDREVDDKMMDVRHARSSLLIGQH